MINVLFFLLVSVAARGDGVLYEGEPCSKNDQQGVCRNIQECQSAVREIAMKVTPTICSFQGKTPIVCCFEESTPTTTASTPKYFSTDAASTTPSSTTHASSDEDCPPIPPGFTISKTGRKALDKCIEYQAKYVYPCEKSVALTGGKNRGSHCGHNVDELIVGGSDAKPQEFPHMALLGYGDDLAAADWFCGGSVISEKFVLTAGHCTSTSRNVAVSYVRTNVLKRSQPLDRAYVYKVARIIKHPDYNPPQLYNDIALLETETDMFLSQFVVPACLPIDSSHKDSRVIAIGFGAVKYKGMSADTLQKVNLTKISINDCVQQYDGYRLLANGVDEKTQLCFGDENVPKDTCQGDSGGPLQIRNRNIRCMYTVVGVTSHGENCGIVGLWALYTNVLHYTPWIESIVWPN